MKQADVELTPPVNPELNFFIEVLERIKNSHKDVINDDALRKNHRNYRKYLGDQSP